MDEEEKQALLDGLDKRLALGEIDLESYNRLRSKFLGEETRPQDGDPLDKTVGALPSEVQKLNCPNCGAPVNAPGGNLEIVICDFCGISYRLKTAEEEMERLRMDLKRWIRDFTDEGAGSISGIDEASRRFIFRDKILPQINLEVNRTIEMFDMTKHQALIDVPLSRVTPNTPFKQTRFGMPVLDDFRVRISEIMSKVQSAEIEKFAIDPADRELIGIVRIKCQEIIYLNNVRNQFESISEDSLKIANRNLTALGELYDTCIELLQPDSADHVFYSSLKKRIEVLVETTEVLNDLMFDMGKCDPSRCAGTLVKIRGVLESLVNDVNSSGKEHREKIPLIEGIKADVGSITVLISSIELYRGFGRSDSGYVDFIEDLEGLISISTDRSGGINWLLNFMSILRSHLDTVYRNGRIPVVTDMSWVKEMIRENVRSSFLGGKETADIETQFFAPFWAASVSFSKQRGILFKQGFSDRGILLLPAIGGNYQPKRIEDESPLYGMCQTAFKRPGIVGKSRFSICPMIDEITAMKKMEMYKNASPALQSGYLRMLGIIYLPAVLVRFARKGERRVTLFGDITLQLDFIPLRKIRIGGINIFISEQTGNQ